MPRVPRGRAVVRARGASKPCAGRGDRVSEPPAVRALESSVWVTLLRTISYRCSCFLRSTPGTFAIAVLRAGGSLRPGALRSIRRALPLRKHTETVACQVTSHQADVDTAFSVLMTYPGGRSCVGTFAFGGAYTNRLVALSPSATVTLERAFTSVPAEGCRVRVQTEARDETVVSDKADAFSGFLGSVLQAIQAKEIRKFRQDLLHDAHAISQLRQAAGLIQ